ncbi:SpoIID/LytB domain-containing protein [Aneurinibacillus thermoaerophilus]|uniref:SpoIID/LytB domain-containing protein n=1 Tax=Aneurinibacillus thermoaerophilus TaxID=143495 RepID=UPI002E24D35E|nr:SpoIID/LytB domain-containing protein [Aneurinibacillus thermoaerophilus]MED0755990.1 SpoIID/LytB domain-containing protein [Aneurinibacillus thermoaerophilus]MED0759686.1 SpoIID/LytB domain-containing protein [Aneurinibacillus thermoaerophilus]
MKLGKVFSVVLSIGLLLPFSGQAQAMDEPTVRVELVTPFASGSEEALTNLSFTIESNYIIENHPNVMLLAGQKYFVQIENGTLSLYQYGSIGLPVPLLQGQSTIRAVPVIQEAKNSIIQVQGKSKSFKYRGAMEFQLGYKGTKPRIIPINELGMENYLKGVVPREMSASWEREALKAQAVAARTYAMRQMIAKHGAAINDTTQYQAYQGVSIEHPNSNAAVEETRGQVLSYNDELIEALYASSNGGHSEAPENVWKNSKGAPYLTAKPDPYDAKISPYKNWQETMTIAQLQEKLKNRTPAIGTIKKVEVKQTYPSGRIADLMIEGDKGTVHLTKDEARSVLGLKSSLYHVQVNYNAPVSPKELLSAYNGVTTERKDIGSLTITNGTTEKTVAGSGLVLQGADQKKTLDQGSSDPAVKPVSVTFIGSGWGHGVGMSQWGARQMAKEGMNYQDILQFYYAPAQISENYEAGN